MVVFEEIPDEITIAINITNCPCRCKGCHSPFLWEDKGEILSIEEVERLVSENAGATCVCLMGGDRNPKEVDEICRYVKEKMNLKSGWYSGMDEISPEIGINSLDYVKIGHYDEELGPLNKETTNQRLYKAENGVLKDITSRFWRKI
jgi:anaerobic ribonucleoside-triphosphate reductase activating protein